MGIEISPSSDDPGNGITSLVYWGHRKAEAEGRLSFITPRHSRSAHGGSEPNNPNTYVIKPAEATKFLGIYALLITQTTTTERVSRHDDREITREEPFVASSCDLLDGGHGRVTLRFETVRTPVDESEPDPSFGSGYQLWRHDVRLDPHDLRNYDITEIDPDGNIVSQLIGGKIIEHETESQPNPQK